MEKQKEDRPVDSTTEEMTEDEIDEALKESFPASDPPPWTLGVDPHVHEDDDEEK
jgi:hypothetical protein